MGSKQGLRLRGADWKGFWSVVLEYWWKKKESKIEFERGLKDED